jgi:hypothetical protein
MKKVIKPIKGFRGYFVSNYGEVYSAWKSSGPGARVGVSLKRLKQIPSSGRVMVGLSRGGKRHTIRIHKLVLEAFVGPCPSGMEACHFPDRDTANNRLDNLRWDTKASNEADKVLHGTSNHGERNGSAKLITSQVRDIRKQREQGKTYRQLSEKYDVSISNIQSICQRWTWKNA